MVPVKLTGNGWIQGMHDMIAGRGAGGDVAPDF